MSEAKRVELMGVGRGVQAGVAGVLMGIANLIPGVSGGTMILAMGLYDAFIDAVAEITALRFSWRRVVFLGLVGGGAIGAILLLAGLILYLLFHYTVAMYALFIGLTLGGAPLLWRALRPMGVGTALWTGLGLGVMLAVAVLKQGGGMPHNTAMDFVSGVVGATTMVLPGVSGSYILLVMEQYDRVVGAVEDRDLGIIVPVGIGAVLGVVGLSNLLKWLLRRYSRATHGVLLGILLGSVVGLWPFGRMPGEKALERRSLAELQSFAAEWGIGEWELVGEDPEALAKHIRQGWGTRTRATYSLGESMQAFVLVVLGFVTTFLVSRLDGGRESVRDGLGEQGVEADAEELP